MATPSNHLERRGLEWIVIAMAALLGTITSLIFVPHVFDGITPFGGPAPQYSHPILLQVFLFPGFILLFPMLMLDAVGSIRIRGISFEALFAIGNAIAYAALAYVFVLIGRFVTRKSGIQK